MISGSDCFITKSDSYFNAAQCNNQTRYKYLVSNTRKNGAKYPLIPACALQEFSLHPGQLLIPCIPVKACKRPVRLPIGTYRYLIDSIE